MRTTLPLLALAFGLSSAPAWGKGTDPTGLVEGVVTGLPDGLALQGVSVTLRSATNEALGVQRTDDNGAFRFVELPAGLYSIEARVPGFFDGVSAPLIVVPGLPTTEHVQLARLIVRPAPPAQPIMGS